MATFDLRVPVETLAGAASRPASVRLDLFGVTPRVQLRRRDGGILIERPDEWTQQNPASPVLFPGLIPNDEIEPWSAYTVTVDPGGDQPLVELRDLRAVNVTDGATVNVADIAPPHPPPKPGIPLIQITEIDVQRLIAAYGQPFTAALLAKLDSIEDNATRDLTGAEIAAAIDAQLGGDAWRTPGVSPGDLADETRARAASSRTLRGLIDRNTAALPAMRGDIADLERRTTDLSIVTHDDWANVNSDTAGAFKLDTVNVDQPGYTDTDWEVSHTANRYGGSSAAFTVDLRIPLDADPADFRLRGSDSTVWDHDDLQWNEGTPDTQFRYFGHVGTVDVGNGVVVRLQKSSRTYQTLFSGDVPAPTRSLAPATKAYVDANAGSGSGDIAPLASRLAAIEADDWVTAPRLASDAVTSDAIADGAVLQSRLGAGFLTRVNTIEAAAQIKLELTPAFIDKTVSTETDYRVRVYVPAVIAGRGSPSRVTANVAGRPARSHATYNPGQTFYDVIVPITPSTDSQIPANGSSVIASATVSAPGGVVLGSAQAPVPVMAASSLLNGLTDAQKDSLRSELGADFNRFIETPQLISKQAKCNSVTEPVHVEVLAPLERNGLYLFKGGSLRSRIIFANDGDPFNAQQVSSDKDRIWLQVGFVGLEPGDMFSGTVILNLQRLPLNERSGATHGDIAPWLSDVSGLSRSLAIINDKGGMIGRYANSDNLIWYAADDLPQTLAEIWRIM